jgi:hypothetical protein
MRPATVPSTGTPVAAVSRSRASGGGQSTEVDPAEALEASTGIRRPTHGHEERGTFRAEPAPDERQRHHRLVVEPLLVVDDDEHGLGAGCVGDEAQDRQADEERIEGVVVHSSFEDGVERDALGFSELIDAVEERDHELVHAGVAERHLRLDTRDADNTEPRRDVDRVPDQR